MEKINLKNYTRGIDKEYQKILMKDGTKIGGNGEMQFDFKMENFQEAQDWLIKEMTGLNQEQIDSLSIKEFEDIIKRIEEQKNPS